MSCLCIGGVCIPYSAVLPVLLIGLQWIAAKLAKFGLLPNWVGMKLGVSSTGQIGSKECCSNTPCCESTVTEFTTDGERELSGNKARQPEHIDNLLRWQTLFASTKKSTLIVKFTAEWCKPCKQIQPCYYALCSKYNKCTFVTLDIDGDECDIISSKMKVAMMPTFVCFRNGQEVGRVTGGNNEEKLKEWVGEMCN